MTNGDRITTRLATMAVCTAAVAVGGPAAFAQLLADELPAELEGVGIVERLDETLPLELAFTDENGNEVTLGSYFQSHRPVILTLNYYNCPMLCDLTLNGMVAGLKDVEWTVGDEFDILTVSIDHTEETGLAEVKRRAYLSQYGRETDGWHFHTGRREQIDELCRRAGFGYRYDERSGDYAHTSTIIFCTPDGRISRYMNDVKFEPRDLKFALIEASQGAIGSPMDKFILFMCYRYDPDAGSYVASAWKIMRLGGVITILVLGVGITALLLKGPRHRIQDATSTLVVDAQT